MNKVKKQPTKAEFDAMPEEEKAKYRVKIHLGNMIPIFPKDDEDEDLDGDEPELPLPPKKKRGRPPKKLAPIPAPSPAEKAVEAIKASADIASSKDDPKAAQEISDYLDNWIVKHPVVASAELLPQCSELIERIKAEYQCMNDTTAAYGRTNAVQRRNLGMLHLELAKKYYKGNVKFAAKATGIKYGTVAGWTKFAQDFKGIPDNDLPKTKAAAAEVGLKRKYNNKKGGKQSPQEIAPHTVAAQIKAGPKPVYPRYVDGVWTKEQPIKDAPPSTEGKESKDEKAEDKIWHETWTMTFEGTESQIAESIKELKTLLYCERFAKLISLIKTWRGVK